MATAREELGKVNAKREQAVNLLRNNQFSGKSQKYQYQKTRKPIPCCPICGGLTTDGLAATDKDVGHRKECWVGATLALLTR